MATTVQYEIGVRARRTAFGMFVLAATALSCGGGDGGVVTQPVEFRCVDSGAPAANTVVLDCAAATSATTWQVDVLVGGPSSGTTELRGLALDVVYDPANIEWVSRPSFSSPLMPNALVAVSLFQGEQGRLIIGIEQRGEDPPKTLPPGTSTVLNLTFRRLTNLTFDPVPIRMENTQASGASTTINFAGSLSLAYQ